MLALCHRNRHVIGNAEIRRYAGSQNRGRAGRDSLFPKDNKRTQVVAGFLRHIEPAGPGAEPAIVEGAVIDQTPSRDVTPAPEPAQSNAAARTTGEIELKLLVDADRMAHFNAAPVIAANARNRGSRKHLKSVYYDTPERLLRRNGLSLRVRRSGARFVQTVKTEVVETIRSHVASRGGERAVACARSHFGNALRPGEASRPSRSAAARGRLHRRHPSSRADDRPAVRYRRDCFRPR